MSHFRTVTTLRAAVRRGLRNALVVWAGAVVAALVLSWLPVNMAYVR